MIKNMNNRIKNKITLLGFKMDYKLFIYMRLISCLLLFLFLFLFVDYGYLVAPLATIIYYAFAEYVILNLAIHRRSYTLEMDALDFFPIFLLALKSGRNIKNAIITSTNIIENDLSKEFKRVLRNIEIGKSLDESLSLLKTRIPSQIINNIIVSIMEANRLGNSLNNSIQTQLSYIKERQKKERIIKHRNVSFKLALVSVIFVFVIIILLMVFNHYL